MGGSWRDSARLAAWLVLLLPLGAVRIASAAGAIEINHAKALAGGVTASDAPGYPVTIDAAGSYVLTGNLQPPHPNLHGIEIPAADVVLDLGGFAITGSTVCTDSCTPTGSGSGIFGTGGRTVVRNGSVKGVGSNGLYLIGGAGGDRVERVSASNNGGAGIIAGYDSVLERASATYNGNSGLAIETGSIVDSISAHNLGVGVSIDSPATVARTSVLGNTLDGIYVSSGGRVAVRDCQIESNGSDGIDTIGGFFEGNRISGHATPGRFGISARGDVAIRLRGNVLHGNNGSDASAQISTTGPMLELGPSSCGSDLVCP